MKLRVDVVGAKKQSRLGLVVGRPDQIGATWQSRFGDYVSEYRLRPVGRLRQ